MSKKKEQRLIFVLVDDGSGNLNINCDFFPRLPLSVEGAKDLHPRQAVLQEIAMNVANVIMDGFAKNMADAQAKPPEQAAAPEQTNEAEGKAGQGPSLNPAKIAAENSVRQECEREGVSYCEIVHEQVGIGEYLVRAQANGKTVSAKYKT